MEKYFELMQIWRKNFQLNMIKNYFINILVIFSHVHMYVHIYSFNTLLNKRN